MKARTILWGLCGLFAAAALGLWLFRATEARQEPPSAPTATASAPRIGGAFQLVDQNGTARNQSLLNGRWSAVFFGFTACPDICPTTLQSLDAVNASLGADRVQVVFVSVDPERDTPAQLKAYLESGSFAPGVVGLTGSAEQVAAIARAYGVYYARRPVGDDYTMDHTSLVFLMDPQGRFSRPLRLDAGPEAAARQIRTALAEQPSRNIRPS